MNIVRTRAVELSHIPAIAYKMKLSAGGAGLRILRLDQDKVGVFSLDRRTGEAKPYGKVEEEIFPWIAVEEAQELTEGLPYSARGKIKITNFSVPTEKEDVLDETEDIDMVGSDEYNAIIERYTNEKGKMNYSLMNKDFIQFASKSTIVENMIEEHATEDDLVHFILKNRVGYLANKKESLSDKEIEALLETLDEINPRSAFKELKNHLRCMMHKV